MLLAAVIFLHYKYRATTNDNKGHYHRHHYHRRHHVDTVFITNVKYIALPLDTTIALEKIYSYPR